MVKYLSSYVGDVDSIPGQGIKIPHATEQLNQCTETLEPVHCDQKNPLALQQRPSTTKKKEVLLFKRCSFFGHTTQFLQDHSSPTRD